MIAAADGSGDVLNVTDLTNFDKTEPFGGQLSSSTLLGLAMGGVVQYGGFEFLNLTLGDGADDLTVNSTMDGTTVISGGVGLGDLRDQIKLETLSGNVTVRGGRGNDAITLFDGVGDAAAPGSLLTLDGGRDDDDITLNLGRRTGLVIDVTDGDPEFGFDELIVNGTELGDAFYLGAGDKSVDLSAGVLVVGQKVNSSGQPLYYRQATDPDTGDGLFDSDGLPLLATDPVTLELIETTDITEFPIVLDNPLRDTVNYVRLDKLVVESFGGDDIFQVDDNAVETVIHMGDGDDRITIATVATTPDEFGVPVVNFEQTTRGTSALMTVYGGDHDDEFNVNHNEAELRLFGQDGDDVFAVNTFLVLTAEGSDAPVNLTTLDGGTGSNSYQYLQNAPVLINGGAGNDTVIITGTPIGDVFVVTDQYIAGAGRQVLISNNIERVVIQGAGGADEIYVLSTNERLTNSGVPFETVVSGGSGNDRVHVGGEPPVLVFDPPPSTVQPAPIRTVNYVTQYVPVVVDPGPISRVIPLYDVNNLSAYAQQYAGPGGDAAVQLNRINYAPTVINYFFFSTTVTLPVSATITIDPRPTPFSSRRRLRW